ncbi:MAG TPA: ATP-binding cassette domain-containing protein [Trebonia sp.]|nr:ATP-binding cassette domain-containing protein [Trebonia sp.]
MRETPPEVNANGSSAGSDQPAPGVGPAVLACHDVTKSYGGVLAVDSVSLEVPLRGLFGLCGFNGAGKSTLFNLLAGSVTADSGSVQIDGKDATGWSAMRRARSGVARTWQTVRLAHGRTAVDNVAAACLQNPGQWMLASLWRPQAAPARERAWAALEKLGIGHLGGQLVDGLTLEAQRLTELARAIVSEPTVLLADEPASGLSATQRSVLAEALTTISEDRAVVVVEHDLDMLTSISGHMWAMVEGRLAYSGDVETFRASPVHARLRGIEQA